MTENETRNTKFNNKSILFWLLIPLAFCLGLFLYPLFFNASEAQAALKAVSTPDQVEQYADSLYRALQSELEFYRSRTDSVYPDVFVKEEALEKQYIRLQNMIAQAKKDEAAGINVRNRMSELKSELLKMQDFVDEQTLSLAEMRRHNDDLLAEKKALAEKLRKESGEKEELEKENSELQEERRLMYEKVLKASVLRISNLKASANRLAFKGSEKETDKAKMTEFIKVCFNVVKNDIVGNGPNKFYLLITDPTGWPIVVESRGSGKIDLSEIKRKNTFFTAMKSFSYGPETKEICLSWSQVPNKPFEKGAYHIEIFNAGYSVGETTLVLK